MSHRASYEGIGASDVNRISEVNDHRRTLREFRERGKAAAQKFRRRKGQDSEKRKQLFKRYLTWPFDTRSSVQSVCHEEVGWKELSNLEKGSTIFLFFVFYLKLWIMRVLSWWGSCILSFWWWQRFISLIKGKKKLRANSGIVTIGRVVRECHNRLCDLGRKWGIRRAPEFSVWWVPHIPRPTHIFCRHREAIERVRLR